MTTMEQLEMEAHRAQLNRDMENLVEKYRRIFEWDVPDIDDALSDRLIFSALRQSLDDIQHLTGDVSGAEPVSGS